MAFKEVTTNRKYVKFSESKPGDVLAEGRYIKKEIDQTYHQPRYLIQGDDGVITVLNSSGQLNKLMDEQLSLGDYVQVTYTGKIKLTKGPMKGKDANQFKVLVDADRSVRIHASTEQPSHQASHDVPESSYSGPDMTPSASAEETVVNAAQTPTTVAAAAASMPSGLDVLNRFKTKKK